nr:hypothetical protein [Tanacetum cinerariifolium]
MSRDVIIVGSTMRIPLLYRGEYSQWCERFMNYLEEKTDGEAIINSIHNGDHPLHVVAQASLAGTTPNAFPTLKDPKFWTAEEKKTRKINRAFPLFFCLTGRGTPGSETIEHSSGMILLLRNGEGDLTTMKFIQADVECSSSSIFTSNDICPRGHIISPLNQGVFARINWFLIFRRNLLKQCSYKISEEEPPSTYMRCTQCPLILDSMIMGPSIPSSSPRVGKEITDSGEKLGIGNSVHKSEDFHAFWSFIDDPAFKLVPPQKLFRGFPISLFDVVNLYRIFDAFFCWR